MSRNGSELIITVSGRLDAISSHDLEDRLDTLLEGIESLIFDFTELEYISSAGLRVLMTSMQILEGVGSVTVRGANADIMEVFEFTGFIDDLNIEKV